MSNFNYIDYFDTYELMHKFREFTKCEVRIMDYMMKHGSVSCSYTELAEIIDGKKDNISNVRRAVLHLEEIGVLDVEKYNSRGQQKAMCGCKLVDDWMDNLLINNVA